jgi:hypothetical protein
MGRKGYLKRTEMPGSRKPVRFSASLHLIHASYSQQRGGTPITSPFGYDDENMTSGDESDDEDLTDGDSTDSDWSNFGMHFCPVLHILTLQSDIAADSHTPKPPLRQYSHFVRHYTARNLSKLALWKGAPFILSRVSLAYPSSNPSPIACRFATKETKRTPLDPSHILPCRAILLPLETTEVPRSFGL